MKSFGSYISKYLVSFVAFILILLFLNAVVFGLTFQKIVTEDYGDSSPQSMLEMTATAATPEQLSDDAVQMLRQNHIWAIYLNTDGQCYWSVDLPDECAEKVTQFKMSHYFQKDILKIIRFLSGTPMMDCWYWAIQKTAIQNSPAITIPLQHFDGSPSLCWECLGLDVLCLFCSLLLSPNAESFTIPNRLCPLWKLWQMESQFHFISAENYRKLQAV